MLQGKVRFGKAGNMNQLQIALTDDKQQELEILRGANEDKEASIN